MSTQNTNDDISTARMKMRRKYVTSEVQENSTCMERAYNQDGTVWMRGKTVEATAGARAINGVCDAI